VLPRDLIDEVRQLGFKSTFARLKFEIDRRLGLEVRRHSVKPIEWRAGKREAEGRAGFFPRPEVVQRLAWAFHSDENSAQIRREADYICAGYFRYFENTAHFKHPSCRWFSFHDGTHIEILHSSKYYKPLPSKDIKEIWEIGRFAWLNSLGRAYVFLDDEKYVTKATSLIDDFAEENPCYQGPHWASEQEVAIRALNLVWFYDVVAKDFDEDLGRKILHLLDVHGEYIFTNIDYALKFIRNNHLVHALVALYVISAICSDHPDAQRWREFARSNLLVSFKEQWTDQGEYVQPSHSYHRSALHGLLWLRVIAARVCDNELVLAVDEVLANSTTFFLAVMDWPSGQVPNWGANDGTLISNWSSSSSRDYRPLCQSLTAITRQELLFENGPWDEEMIWFLGVSSLSLPRRKSPPVKTWVSYKNAGLHILRLNTDVMVALRAGSPISRYGMQADQLHVDFWHKGRNLLPDAGSYNYNKSSMLHNWFRGTGSHNTVLLDGLDQMVPHRTFKYLRWSSGIVDRDEDGWVYGVHDGYSRVEGRWYHARVLIPLADALLVLDRVWPKNTSANHRVCLHWQSTYLNILEENCFAISPEGCTMAIAASSKAAININFGKRSLPDGWVSEHYNSRSPVHAINYGVDTDKEVFFLSAIFEAGVFRPVFEEDRLVSGDWQLELERVRVATDELLARL
jgi:hypothetical protein